MEIVQKKSYLLHKIIFTTIMIIFMIWYQYKNWKYLQKIY
jgi:hypothetical protein